MKLRYISLLLLLPILLCLCSCGGHAAAVLENAVIKSTAPDALDEAAVTASEETVTAPAPEEEEEEGPAEVSLAMTEDGEHPKLIAHAGGAVYGYRLTNSLDALNHSYEEGFRFIEVDLNKTSDGELVLIHDWDSVSQRMLGRTGPCTLQEFQDCTVMAGMTLLTMADLLDWLADHPDCNIITDIKYEDNCAMLEMLAEQAGDQISQFIPQVFTYEEYDKIQEMGYDRVILTMYHLYGKNMKTDELIQFARDKAPWAVTISESRLNQALLTALVDESVAVYAHTVNTVDAVDKWADYGLTGIYTDYFTPSHWLY